MHKFLDWSHVLEKLELPSILLASVGVVLFIYVAYKSLQLFN
jgi:hypothetical protein